MVRWSERGAAPVSQETIDPRNTTEQRKFGFGLCVALLVLAGLRWRAGAVPPVLLLMLSVTFLVVSVFLPWALRPLLAGWTRAARAAGWVVTRLFLGLVYYTMMAPARLVLRATGEDPLRRRWDPDAASYWEAPEEQPGDLDACLGHSSRGVLDALIALPVFLWRRKRFWLAPIAVALLLLSLLLLMIGSLGGWP